MKAGGEMLEPATTVVVVVPDKVQVIRSVVVPGLAAVIVAVADLHRVMSEVVPGLMLRPVARRQQKTNLMTSMCMLCCHFPSKRTGHRTATLQFMRRSKTWAALSA